MPGLKCKLFFFVSFNQLNFLFRKSLALFSRLFLIFSRCANQLWVCNWITIHARVNVEEALTHN